MSRSGEIVLEWGGEPERAFRLGIGQIKKLQEKLNAGPAGIAARCHVTVAAEQFKQAKDWISLSRLDLSQIAEKTHVREILLQGLLGVNVALPVADKLVSEWVDERPLDENLITAILICNAHIYGVEDEKPAGESEAVAAVSPISPTASTASAKTASTRSARRAASLQPRSTP